MHTGRSGPAVAIGLAFVLSVAGCTSAETSLSEPQASRPRVATTVPPAATTPPGPGSTATGSDEASATPSLTSGRRGLVEWIMALGVAGGADIPEETAVALLARGSCAEARKVARDAEQPLPAFYDGAAAACLAAFDGRDDLWAYAEEVASRALPLRDCLDRAVFALLSRLVDIHRKEPTITLERKAGAPGETLPCPRILRLIPEHGPPQGGYELKVVGVHLPPVVVIHFTQYIDFEPRDIPITVHSVGSTEAVFTVPPQLAGAERSVAIIPEGWPLGPIATPEFVYDDPDTAPTAPPAVSDNAPATSPSTLASPTPTNSP
jgi:hypothetical protein